MSSFKGSHNVNTLLIDFDKRVVNNFELKVGLIITVRYSNKKLFNDNFSTVCELRNCTF